MRREGSGGRTRKGGNEERIGRKGRGGYVEERRVDEKRGCIK